MLLLKGVATASLMAVAVCAVADVDSTRAAGLLAGPQDHHSGLIPVELAEAEPSGPHKKTEQVDEPEPMDEESTKSLEEPRRYPELGHGGNNKPPEGVYAYCYPFTYDEVLTKCATAAEEPGIIGVYMPLMMEVQRMHEPVYYEKVQELVDTTGLRVVGIAYENPRWSLIRDIVNTYPGLFAGVMLEWVGPRACPNQILKPKEEHLEAIRQNTTEGILRYFFREQNVTLCETSSPLFLGPSTGLNNTLPFSYGIEPVFACFAGFEGLCFKALQNYPELACSNTQRFCFNPYELGGGRLMHMMNETCHGLRNIDLYGTL